MMCLVRRGICVLLICVLCVFIFCGCVIYQNQNEPPKTNGVETTGSSTDAPSTTGAETAGFSTDLPVATSTEPTDSFTDTPVTAGSETTALSTDSPTTTSPETTAPYTDAPAITEPETTPSTEVPGTTIVDKTDEPKDLQVTNAMLLSWLQTPTTKEDITSLGFGLEKVNNRPMSAGGAYLSKADLYRISNTDIQLFFYAKDLSSER